MPPAELANQGFSRDRRAQLEMPWLLESPPRGCPFLLLVTGQANASRALALYSYQRRAASTLLMTGEIERATVARVGNIQQLHCSCPADFNGSPCRLRGVILLTPERVGCPRYRTRIAPSFTDTSTVSPAIRASRRPPLTTADRGCFHLAI